MISLKWVIINTLKKNQQHSLYIVSDQKIHGYKIKYEKALKITTTRTEKWIIVKFSGHPVPPSGQQNKNYIWKEKNIYKTSTRLYLNNIQNTGFERHFLDIGMGSESYTFETQDLEGDKKKSRTLTIGLKCH